MKKLAGLLAGAMLMMATSAFATPISGSITFTGGAQFLDAGGAVVNTAALAKGIKFLRPAGGYTLLQIPNATAAGSFEIVNSVSGNYASLPDPEYNLVTAFYTNFTFSPVLFPNPVTLWSITSSGVTYDFEMTSVTSSVNDGHLFLKGKGMLGITGFDDTLGDWTFSSNGTGAKIAFSAASAVPEPGTMVLLGFGMLGLAIYGKRRMNKEA